jgi:nucleoid-associated protein YgaU
MGGAVGAGPLQKAYLKPLEGSGKTVEFMFNPTELTISKRVAWQAGKQKGVDLPEVEFKGGQPRTTTLNLFVDMYEENKSVYDDFVKDLEKLASVDPQQQKKDKKPRPPFVRFGWGKTVLFKSVITSLKVNYTLFHADGRPARAKVTIELQEVKDDPGAQNPTSAGDAGRRSHMVMPGETLDLISYMELGNPQHWRHIAELNGIDNPFALRAGQQLVIAEPE